MATDSGSRAAGRTAVAGKPMGNATASSRIPGYTYAGSSIFPADVETATRSPVTTPSRLAVAGETSAHGLQDTVETVSGISRSHGSSALRPSPRSTVGKMTRSSSPSGGGEDGNRRKASAAPTRSVGRSVSAGSLYE